MRSAIVFGLSVLVAATAVQAQGQGQGQDGAQRGQRMVFSSAHEVLAQAIRHGSASGELRGEVAAHYSRQFNSASPLLVEAHAIKDLTREGCKRVQLDTTKLAVPGPVQPKSTAIHG